MEAQKGSTRPRHQIDFYLNGQLLCCFETLLGGRKSCDPVTRGFLEPPLPDLHLCPLVCIHYRVRQHHSSHHPNQFRSTRNPLLCDYYLLQSQFHEINHLNMSFFSPLPNCCRLLQTRKYVSSLLHKY